MRGCCALGRVEVPIFTILSSKDLWDSKLSWFVKNCGVSVMRGPIHRIIRLILKYLLVRYVRI